MSYSSPETVKTVSLTPTDQADTGKTPRRAHSSKGLLAPYLAVVLLVLVSFWVLFSTQFDLKPYQATDYQRYSCQTGSVSASQPVLKVLVFLMGVDVQEVSQQLCTNPHLKRLFSAIDIIWQAPSQADRRSLYEQQYHLVLSRLSLMQQIAVEGIDNYQLVAQLPDYRSQLLSVSEQPRMQDDFFRGKTLGLIDNPLSVSGYRIPRSELKKQGIDEHAFFIQYYGSHTDLHRALIRGEVDVIASFLADTQGLHDRDVYHLELQERLPGPGWFLHPDSMDTELHCALVDALMNASQHSDPSYLSALTVRRACQSAELSP